MECWNYIETTSSGRPILRENEKDILIDYSVGLYDGKLRVQDKQNGRIFLTSQRIIYIDDKHPTNNSVSLELDNIKTIDYSSSFLKRSARIIIFLKENSIVKSENKKEKDNTKQNVVSNWICPICQFENQSNGKFTNESISQLTCENCGISANFSMIEDSITYKTIKDETKQNICPSCTFINHPYLTNCEICGTRLLHSEMILNRMKNYSSSRVKLNANEFVQLSFRKSDGRLFSQSLETLIDKLNKKDIFNKDVVSINGIAVNDNEIKKFQDSFNPGGQNNTDNITMVQDKLNLVGISGLERSRENQLVNNDILFNSALSDMNKLISLANNIERLYRRTSNNDNDDNEVKIKNSLLTVDRDKFSNKDLFLDEIAREIYEFSISEFRDNDKGGNVMITLVDLYAMYNKAMRIGTGFISPDEMRQACERFEKLGLNELKLMKINDRILCISSVDSLNYVSTQIINFVTNEPGSDILKINQQLNSNSSRSNWTMGVLVELLQYTVDEGELVIDEQLSGIYYYKNNF